MAKGPDWLRQLQMDVPVFVEDYAENVISIIYFDETECVMTRCGAI